MLRTKKCGNCLYCKMDEQVDMGCTMDICNIAEHNIGFYSGLMCQDWKAKRNNEKILDSCPMYKARPKNYKMLNTTEKAKFLLWYEENKKQEKYRK